MEKLTAKAQISIQKPIDLVFETILDPEQMKNYFISKSSGRMEKGKEIEWEFPEFEGSFPVKIIEVIPTEYISFEWDPHSLVEIYVEQYSKGNTSIKVTETGYQMDEDGLKWVIGQTEGWANFLACMKAWLEYKVHLRKGAFDFIR
jgi:uncharacterized protein YndB with AHSA1/START domain